MSGRMVFSHNGKRFNELGVQIGGRRRKPRKFGPTEKQRVRYLKYIKSPEWAMFRLSVFAARGAQCERCPSTTALEVHHKHYNTFGHERLEDVEILCNVCHSKQHGRWAKKG